MMDHAKLDKLYTEALSDAPVERHVGTDATKGAIACARLLAIAVPGGIEHVVEEGGGLSFRANARVALRVPAPFLLDANGTRVAGHYCRSSVTAPAGGIAMVAVASQGSVMRRRSGDSKTSSFGCGHLSGASWSREAGTRRP